MAGKIFINYRRGDDAGHAGRLFDRLQEAFEPQQLFLDVDNIAPGLDFVRVLNERVAECDIVLAVIGKNWIDARDLAGARRLDDPDDFVRIELESALTQGKRVIPVLVGDARMPRLDELPEVLRPLARRNAVRLTHERFRADTGGLVKALQQALAETDALRRTEAERLRAEEEELRRKAAAETTERAAEELRRQHVAAKQRAEEEQAFTSARRANNIAAIDAFQQAYPKSQFGDEVLNIKAALLAREEAHSRAMASDDLVSLRSFCDTYKTGADVKQVRARLLLLEPKRSWQSKPTIIVPVALAVILASAFAVWFAVKPSPSTQQVSTVSNPPLPIPASAAPTAPALPAESAPVIAPMPPSSEQANSVPTESEAKVLETWPMLTPDAIVWDLVKDSKDPDQLRRFLEQFPDSSRRPDVEQRIASLATQPPTSAVASAPNPHDLTRLLQVELKRVGCFTGAVNGEFDDTAKAAWHKFVRLTSISMPDEVSPDAINAVRAINKRVCPLVCPTGKHADGELCLPNPPPPSPPPSVKPKRAERVVEHARERATPAPAPSPQASPLGAGRNTVPCRNRGGSLLIHRLPGGGCGY